MRLAWPLRSSAHRAWTCRARGDLVLAICRALGATRYLSGRGGSTYLDRDRFAAAGIEIEVQSFRAPAYPRSRRIAPEHDRGISALDAWMSLGSEAAGLLSGETAAGVMRAGA